MNNVYYCAMSTPLNGGSPCTRKSLHSSNKELGKLSQNLQQQPKFYLALGLFAVKIIQTDVHIKSLKARWCICGDLQEPMENTFAPVVMWSTVRLLMYFTSFFKLHTWCLHFSNAFVLAALDEPIYFHLPLLSD